MAFSVSSTALLSIATFLPFVMVNFPHIRQLAGRWKGEKRHGTQHDGAMFAERVFRQVPDKIGN